MSLRPSQKEHFQSINPQKDQFPSLSGLTNCSLPTPEKEVEGCWSPFRIIAQPCPFSSWSTSELRNCKSFYKSSQVVLASIHQGWLQKKGYLFPRKLARNKRLHSSWRVLTAAAWRADLCPLGIVLFSAWPWKQACIHLGWSEKQSSHCSFLLHYIFQFIFLKVNLF